MDPEFSATRGPEFGDWGVDLAGMDVSVKPGDDFYRYVNGTWHAEAEIPADKSEVGPAASLQDLALDQMRTLVEEMVADTDAPEGSDRRKIADWYSSLLDEDTLAARGLEPLGPELDRIEAVTDRAALQDLLADNLAGLGAGPLSVETNFDRAKTNVMMVSIATGGMSLPVREIYLEARYEPVRKLYREHIARVFALAGVGDGDARAERVLGLETRIAEVTWTLAEKRDPRKQFNPTPASELPKLAPGIDWPRFLARAGVGAPEIVNVSTLSSIAGVVALIAEAPLEDWRDYLTYRLFESAHVALAEPFRDEFFSFFGKVLADQAEPTPRWQEALLSMSVRGRPLMDPMSKVFVDRYVPAEARPEAREMVDNLLAAFDARLANIDWMADETRANARDKLAKTTIKVIYPEVWRSVDGLEVVRGDAIGNMRRGAAFSRAQDLSYLQTPLDRALFFSPVFVVNAYAMPPWNEIVFLAAIVRPPFFDPAADPVVNYGAMGAVIGHEVSHLFDDQGRLSDGDGLLRDWWTEEDAKRFVAVAERLAAQVASYEPLPGKHVNGALTLGESIADVAGLNVAYDALQIYLDENGREVVDGFTPEQRFFLGYAQAWRWKARDAYLDQLLGMDPHPPSNIRPQTVRNVDAWYEAFDVRPGDALYLAPEDRVKPW